MRGVGWGPLPDTYFRERTAWSSCIKMHPTTKGVANKKWGGDPGNGATIGIKDVGKYGWAGQAMAEERAKWERIKACFLYPTNIPFFPRPFLYPIALLFASLLPTFLSILTILRRRFL